ncbi:MAG: hypothetical protein GYB68_10705, partial [Chloroflexi bacterium]|nr:hypothetical protein [Chloroflexota bacterium]
MTSVQDAFEQKPYDFLLFSMKAYDTANALIDMQMAGITPPPIVSFQNGVGNEQTIADFLGPDQVVAATLTTPVSSPEPGHIVEEKQRGIAIATDAPHSEMVHSAFRDTSLKIDTVASAQSLKWSKLLLNITANAVPAILDMPPGEVYADPSLFEIERAALRETLYFIDQQDIELVNFSHISALTLARAVKLLPGWLLRPVMRQRVINARGDKLPSLLLGLRTGLRRTEIAWLNGAVAKAADDLNRYAPVNHTIALMLSDIAAGRLPWESVRR